MNITQKMVKPSEENSLIEDYAPTDVGTEVNNSSSIFYRQRDSKGVSAAKSSQYVKNQAVKRNFAPKNHRLAYVAQQTPFMTLNQDINEDDINDFAFTVQGKKDSLIRKGLSSNKSK